MKKRGKTADRGVFLNSKTVKAVKEEPSFDIIKLALKQLKGKDIHLQSIKDDSSFKILKLALEELEGKYKLRLEDLQSLFLDKPLKVQLPVSIFTNTKLSPFEIICKYLKEEKELKISQVASITKRDHRTVWTTYSNSLKKQKSRLVIKKSAIEIPVGIFSNRKFSVLEILVSFLKEQHNLSFAQISSLLQKDPRNIWTVYSRFRNKR
jgi:hypothetical protein